MFYDYEILISFCGIHQMQIHQNQNTLFLQYAMFYLSDVVVTRYNSLIHQRVLILMDWYSNSPWAAPRCVSVVKVRHADLTERTFVFLLSTKGSFLRKKKKLVSTSATVYVTFCDHTLNAKTLAASLLKAKFFHGISTSSL